MSNTSMRNVLLALAAGAVLAACGSNKDDDVAAPAARTTDVPQSALDSPAGLVAYLNQLIDTMTNDTTEPILVGDAVLPLTETSEPL
jgi:ABC-type glycerol-3-phosphate transport system substrate-binding protein